MPDVSLPKNLDKRYPPETLMVVVDAPCSLEHFRRFIYASTCRSFAPQAYMDDNEIFPEREDGGVIYVEAVDKVTLKKMNGIIFVNARDVLGVIYNSNSGSTSMRWRQTQKTNGRATGDISKNSLRFLAEAGVLTLRQVEDCIDALAKAANK